MNSIKKLIVIGIFLMQVVSCEDLSSFSTNPDEIYAGNIVQPEKVRKGFGKFSRMELTINTDDINTTPGTIKVESQEETEEPEIIFDNVSLRPVYSLKYDTLSNFDFPTGRLKNYLFLAPITSAKYHNGVALIVISLMSDGKIEVRIIFGENTLFGIFVLEKQKKS